MKLDYTKITDVQIDGLTSFDSHDYADAFISNANYDGREMTDAELDLLNEDSDYVYNKAIASISTEAMNILKNYGTRNHITRRFTKLFS